MVMPVPSVPIPALGWGSNDGVTNSVWPHSLQAAFGCSLALCTVAQTGLQLSSISCMLSTPSPCRILQPSALLCCKGGGEVDFVFSTAVGRWEAAGRSPPSLHVFLWVRSHQTHASWGASSASPRLLCARVLLQCINNISFPCRDLQPQGSCCCRKGSAGAVLQVAMGRQLCAAEHQV